MCGVNAYNKEHVLMYDNVIIGGGRPIPSTSSKELLISFGITINFIYNCFLGFEFNYDNRIKIYKIMTSELFKTIPKFLLPPKNIIIKKKSEKKSRQ